MTSGEKPGNFLTKSKSVVPLNRWLLKVIFGFFGFTKSVF